MLVKTHQSRFNGVTRTTLVSTSEKDVQSKILPEMRQGYRPVSSMTESTVVVYYHCNSIAASKQDQKKMRGARRVVTFCLLVAFLPVMLLIFPLYLRNTVFAERHFTLMSADVLTLTDGISSYFCQGHKVQALEGWFSAHQMQEEPILSSERRTATIETSMVIPDDRLEYWGFPLLPESTITLSMCASSPGARLLVVRGEKNLELCGLLHQSSTATVSPPTAKPIEVPVGDEESVLVTFEQKDKVKPVPEQDEIENIGGEETDPTDSTIISTQPTTEELEETTHHPIRHERSRLRFQRNTVTQAPKYVILKQATVTNDFEGAVEHGGNTANYTDDIDKAGDSSLSSFEADLLTCFSGKTLFQRGFASGGKSCENLLNWNETLRLSHTIRSQGHFYYVFYSDNDLEVNTINVRFHINASKYDFSTAKSQCDNVTECAFHLKFLGGDGSVFVEANSDVLLVSTCEPRLMVYLMFPACALLFVLMFGLL